MTAHAPFRWTTAAIADAADTSPMELSALSAHVDHCNGSRGRWFALRCMTDAAHQFIAPRFVTTLIFAATMIGLTAIVL
jgi:hypothetical protein